MNLQWEPNYRVVKLPSPWSAVVENQTNGRTKRCNVGDLKLKHPLEDWELKSSPIGRAAKFVNHPENLPDVDIKPDSGPALTSEPKDAAGTKYHLRQMQENTKKWKRRFSSFSLPLDSQIWSALKNYWPLMRC